MEKFFLPKEIIGKRVTLKRHHEILAQKMYDYVVEDRERLAKFLPWANKINSVDDEIEFIKNCNEGWEAQQKFAYGIYGNSDHEYMGNISVFDISWVSNKCEIGYWILSKFEKKGYMSESVSLLEDTLFSLGFNRIQIRYDKENERSRNIPFRLGYTFEGRLREVVKSEDGYRDLDISSKLKSDLFESKFQIEYIEKHKGKICEKIIRNLPEWFGLEEAIKNYILEVEKLEMLVASEGENPVGFLSVKKHNRQSAEAYVLGVLGKYHRKGIGRALFKKLIRDLKKDGFKMLQVKTLGKSNSTKEYDKTRKFYESLGFISMEEFSELWDEDNPCLVMVLSL